MKIIISRTDNLGDVILTLPVAGVLKSHFPDCHIIFLGKSYTRPIIEACKFVDEFWDKEEILAGLGSITSGKQTNRDDPGYKFDIRSVDAIIHIFPDKEICRWAKIAGIPLRISTSHRWYSWLYCNKRVHYSRKKSNLHEAQLNLKLLAPLGISNTYSQTEIPQFYGFETHNALNVDSGNPQPASVFRLILHPKSKGSAREWGLDNFSELIGLLPASQFQIFITGTKEEGSQMQAFLQKHHNRITDLTGKLSMDELISFIGSCDGMVAASTGPLHMAAALGKYAIGLYSPMRPIFPQRWAPLGAHAAYFVLEKKCEKCRKSNDCECIRSIRPQEVAMKLQIAKKERQEKKGSAK